MTEIETQRLNEIWRLRAINAEMLEALKAIKEECPADSDLMPKWYAAWQKLELAIARAESNQ